MAAMYIVPDIVANEDVAHRANDGLKGLRLLTVEWLIELAGKRGNGERK